MRPVLPAAVAASFLSLLAPAPPAAAGVLILGDGQPPRAVAARHGRKPQLPTTFQGGKVGFAFLGAPAFTVGYSVSQELGANFALVGDFSLVNTGLFSGRITEIGLGWAPVLAEPWLRLPISARGGYATVSSLDGDVPTFGGAATVGLEATWGPLRAIGELGWQSYLPLRQVGGAEDGRLIQPYGLMGRVGVSAGF